MHSHGFYTETVKVCQLSNVSFAVVKFKKINCLATKERIEQFVVTKVLKYYNGTLPFYVNEIFVPVLYFLTSTWIYLG